MPGKSFAVFFTASLGLLLIPIPTWMIDLCVILNLAFSIILLLGVFKVSNPLKLYTLPTLILLLTIFRLCLNIATSRSILGSGEAGQIVENFGRLANAGDVSVGIVIFILITIVQIVVVTKGAERVAEVSARFALDSLPGRQMSIDADLRAGLIDLEGARFKREELQVESRFHGSLDGAMKFVKGDAIAGAIITLVNLLGGGAIGAFRDQLPFTDVLAKYSTLTIGDGLVAQLSSFACAVAAGIMVTRVTKEGSPGLSADLLGQLAEIKVAGLSTGGILIILGALPGAPHLIFIICGAIVCTVFYKAKRAGNQTIKTKETNNSPFKLNYLLLLRLTDASLVTPALYQSLWGIRQRLWLELGLAIPQIEVEIGSKSDFVELLLRGEVIHSYVHDEVMRDLDKIYQDIYRVRGELVDDNMTQRLCDIFESECSSLITMVIPQILSITGLTSLLRTLVEEEVSLRNFDVILQAAAESFNLGEAGNQILPQVRIKLRRTIQAQIRRQLGEFPKRLIMDPIVDLSLVSAHKSGRLPENRLIEELIAFSSEYLGKSTIMAVSKSSRELVREIFKLRGVAMNVFAHEELIGFEFERTECFRPSWIEDLV